MKTIRSVMPELDEGLVLATPGDTYLDLGLLLPMLTGDVLVHTWDLPKAVGTPVSLDPDLVERSYDDARKGSHLRTPDMFGPSIPVPGATDPVTKLVALLGRDPEWRAP